MDIHLHKFRHKGTDDKIKKSATYFVTDQFYSVMAHETSANLSMGSSASARHYNWLFQKKKNCRIYICCSYDIYALNVARIHINLWYSQRCHLITLTYKSNRKVCPVTNAKRVGLQYIRLLPPAWIETCREYLCNYPNLRRERSAPLQKQNQSFHYQLNMAEGL